jgi:transposase
MEFKKGAAREQAILFPESLDEYVTANNPVRFLDAFVDQIDLKEAGFARLEPGVTGRPPYDPRDLLKLYIYGYLNRIRTSRKLEKETHRNVEVMWLVRKLCPDHKTIADFRKDNRKAFKQVCREFMLLCRRLGLFGNELIAVDGSRFKADNSPRRNFTKKSLQARLDEIDEKIEAYLSELDEADEQAADQSQLTEEELRDRIQQLKQRKQTYGDLMQEMEQAGESQVSLTDPDCRSTTKNPKAKVGYNAQIAVDEKHDLIVAEDVVNDINDTEQLCKMSLEAKEVLGVDRLKAVADAGYYNALQIRDCEKENIEPYVPNRDSSNCTARGLFSKEQFQYDPVRDVYTCPAGQELTFKLVARKRSEGPATEHYIRHYATSECASCHLRGQCTTNKKGRVIYRWQEEHLLEEMAQRVSSNPQIMKKRKELVEHPFGTMKFWNDQSHFVVRGLEKVRAEFSLMTLAYNIKRVLNLLGVPAMIEALGLISETLSPSLRNRLLRPHQGLFRDLERLWIPHAAQDPITARTRWPLSLTT